MNKLPIAVSNPHAGLYVPSLVREFCHLTPAEISADGDEGAARIYTPLKDIAECYTSTPVARAIVDMNRAATDFSKDGVIKTHTCWDVPVYTRDLPAVLKDELLDIEYHPYHERLTDCSTWGLKFGIDCHTMAAIAPPVAPDPGSKRPPICLSDLEGKSLPKGWMTTLVTAFEEAFELPVAVNEPFKGGHITQRHHRDMPWVQIELSRDAFMDNGEKSNRVIQALKIFCQRQFNTLMTAQPEHASASHAKVNMLVGCNGI